MLKCVLVAVALIFALSASVISSDEQPRSASSNGQEVPYDELADSPQYVLEGCGVFPRVRVLVNDRETEGIGFIRSDRTYLPARETLERLGGEVTWVQIEQAFYARFLESGTTVRVRVGSNTADIYRYNPDAQYGAGERVRSLCMGSAPIICGGRVFAPVRSAAEAAGASVQYDRSTRTVHVYPPKSDERQVSRLER